MKPMLCSPTVLEGKGVPGGTGRRVCLGDLPHSRPHRPWTGPSASQVHPPYAALALYDNINMTKCPVREPLAYQPEPRTHGRVEVEGTPASLLGCP